MPSVTISASYGARGERVAQAVAEQLGLGFLDRAIPLAVARQLHLSAESVETHDERAPSRWDQFFSAFDGVGSGSTVVGVAPVTYESPETFRSATEAILLTVADSSGAVILGRAGRSCSAVVMTCSACGSTDRSRHGSRRPSQTAPTRRPRARPRRMSTTRASATRTSSIRCTR